jgi:hypothetical protein
MKFGIRDRIVTLAIAAPALALAADGLSVREDVWPTWQARLTFTSTTPGPGAELHGRGVATSVLGDYYFSVPRLLPLSVQGGMRATSGMIASSGLRVPLAAGADGTDSVPYVGLGYTHSSIAGGWGFTADVGMVANNPAAAWRLGRAVLGDGPAMDDAIRNLRLSPMIHLGVRYTF